MYFKNVGYLMKEITTLDSKHRPKISYIETLFYCNEKSIGQSEFYQSASVGFKPEIKLEAKLIDLTNITHVKYNDIIYKILRTYKKEDIVELVLTSTVVENK
ncbi:MAG: hypothetical protein IJI58_05665 [Bacilli bacterium]|nr:hypothetical protein [Bacilli bacterium]